MRRRLVAVLAALLAAVAAVDTAALATLRRQGLLARPVLLADLAEVRTAYEPPADDPIARAFAGRDPRALVAQVMNAVQAVGPEPSGDPAAVLEHVRRGGGVACGGMSRLFFAALRANGLDARIVTLRRSLLDRLDTHTTVEVRMGGRWVIVDPTFHVTFERNGRLLGAVEIHEALLHGGAAGIVPVFHGPVAYPARLETYYIHWLPLFTHVAVVDRMGPAPSLLARVPPARYWLGPAVYVPRTPGVGDDERALREAAVFGAVVLLPTTAAGLGLALVLAAAAPLARRRARHRL